MKSILLYFNILSPLFFFLSCQKKVKVDCILKDATIYTMNSNNDVAQCVAIQNGTIVAVGSNRQILKNFESDSVVSLINKYVYPAFTDAHAHFLGLANYLGECNLYQTKSINEVIQKLKTFYKENPDQFWITGRGWDQNLFDNKEFPTKEALDSVFPNIPVCLTRIDGHAIWTNSKAIQIAKINPSIKVEGGEMILNRNGEPSGIFIDNAKLLIEQHIPQASRKKLIQLLKKADSICQKNYIQYVHDAGLDLWQIQLLDSLIDQQIIKTKIYAMALPTKENIQYFLQHGCIDKPNFKVRAFKLYIDGALGSRGALLKHNYSDKDTRGLLLIPMDSLHKLLKILYNKNFQVCAHAIGDSANKLILQAYATLLPPDNDRRWRIEHAQVIDTLDLHYFQTYNIIPSVQPTHAISDKNWAIQRLGNQRIKYAYAYQSLWQQNAKLALGTDFPVEDVSPLKTFFASVFRCDYNIKDTTAFNSNERLTRLQTLRGMTIDAAYAGFYEKETGTIEAGKRAEFTILPFDLLKIDREKLSNFILSPP